jgi:anti-anti-sigma factor
MTGATALVPADHSVAAPLLSVAVDVRSCTVTLAGELDLATAGLLEDVAHTLLTRPRRDVTVRVDELTFIDSAGAAALAALARQVASRGRRTAVVGANARVERVLRMCGHGGLLEAPACVARRRRVSRRSESLPVVSSWF